MNLPRVLSEASDVMAGSHPGRIVESLPVEERQIQIEVLQGVQLSERPIPSPAAAANAARSRSRNSQRRSDRRAWQELVFPGEPQIVSEIVVDRAIRTAKLEGVVAADPGQSVLKLSAPLADDVWSAKGAAKPRQPADDDADLRPAQAARSPPSSPARIGRASD